MQHVKDFTTRIEENLKATNILSANLHEICSVIIIIYEALVMQATICNSDEQPNKEIQTLSKRSGGRYSDQSNKNRISVLKYQEKEYTRDELLMTITRMHMRCYEMMKMNEIFGYGEFIRKKMIESLIMNIPLKKEDNIDMHKSVSVKKSAKERTVLPELKKLNMSMDEGNITPSKKHSSSNADSFY